MIQPQLRKVAYVWIAIVTLLTVAQCVLVYSRFRTPLLETIGNLAFALLNLAFGFYVIWRRRDEDQIST